MNTAIKTTFPLLIKNISIVCYLLWIMMLSCSLGLAQKIATQYKYDSGIVSSEGFLEDGKPDGYWKTYYPNGQKKSEGNRREFKLDSLWIFYNEEGIRTTEITYTKDIRSGPTTTYKDGFKFEMVNYEDDIRAGEALTYYPTGEVQKRMVYLDGKAEGQGYEYDRDSRIITLLEYKNGDLKRAEKINRYDGQGKKRGMWISYHPNGVVMMEGPYMNNLKNGIFKTYDKKGDLIGLEKYIDDNLEQDNPESVILDVRSTFFNNGRVKSSGGYVDGKKEGIHRVYSTEGELVAGELFQQGEKIGDGMLDNKGDYQGEWKLYYPGGGLKAEGSYINSKRNGDWTFYFSNGKVESQGKYIEGLPHGAWKWYYENKQVRRTEYYRRGREDGDSEEFSLDGRVLTKGQFINGLKEGEWFYEIGDHTERGAYQDGERTGKWIYKYPDGQVNFTGEFVAGLSVGKHRWYYPSGKVKKEGKYSSGVRVGTWNTYDEDGTRALEIKYKNGLEHKINGQTVTSSSEGEVTELQE